MSNRHPKGPNGPTDNDSKKRSPLFIPEDKKVGKPSFPPVQPQQSGWQSGLRSPETQSLNPTELFRQIQRLQAILIGRFDQIDPNTIKQEGSMESLDSLKSLQSCLNRMKEFNPKLGQFRDQIEGRLQAIGDHSELLRISALKCAFDDASSSVDGNKISWLSPNRSDVQGLSNNFKIMSKIFEFIERDMIDMYKKVFSYSAGVFLKGEIKERINFNKKNWEGDLNPINDRLLRQIIGNQNNLPASKHIDDGRTSELRALVLKNGINLSQESIRAKELEKNALELIDNIKASLDSLLGLLSVATQEMDSLQNRLNESIHILQQRPQSLSPRNAAGAIDKISGAGSSKRTSPPNRPSQTRLIPTKSKLDQGDSSGSRRLSQPIGNIHPTQSDSDYKSAFPITDAVIPMPAPRKIVFDQAHPGESAEFVALPEDVDSTQETLTVDLNASRVNSAVASILKEYMESSRAALELAGRMANAREIAHEMGRIINAMPTESVEYFREIFQGLLMEIESDED